ncbi:MAG TPA: 3-methyl-2-oxobutanoate hydroxymethyltransferase [Phycisphaerae bacterium]|nr:3-methyl-2-oxobutanoate hydroxymethyltransferase [Phycisphaerae bacterium]
MGTETQHNVTSGKSGEHRAARKITLAVLRQMRQEQRPIAMLTCYDFPTAQILAQAGVPLLLVGDSVATTVLGEKSTIPATMDFMVTITRAVRNGAPGVFLLADMPFGSYSTIKTAVSNAKRFLAESGADAVKVECDRRHEAIIAAMAAAGIPICAHLGLLPQHAAQEGGYRYRGRTMEDAERIVSDGVTLAKAGAVLLLLEAVPDEVSRRVVEAVDCPVLGCGAGSSCHGHVVVLHDMLGLSGQTPRFVDRLADLPSVIGQAARAWVTAVESREYPASRHQYHMK